MPTSNSSTAKAPDTVESACIGVLSPSADFALRNQSAAYSGLPLNTCCARAVTRALSDSSGTSLSRGVGDGGAEELISLPIRSLSSSDIYGADSTPSVRHQSWLACSTRTSEAPSPRG